MLLPTMTHEEERKEVLKDLPNVERWDKHRWKTYYRMSLRLKDFPKFVFTEYVSPMIPPSFLSALQAIQQS